MIDETQSVRKKIADLAEMHAGKMKLFLHDTPLSSVGVADLASAVPGDLYMRYDDDTMHSGAAVAWDGEKWVEIFKAKFIRSLDDPNLSG